MAWLIKCCDPKCKKLTRASNIVELVSAHRNRDGWFLCSCGKRGYIEKTFRLQEQGQMWKPFLRAMIPLAKNGTYEPFVFLVSYKPNAPVTDVWFSYYKDLRRRRGGRLKLGHGPGGPPVLGKGNVLHLIHQLGKIGYFSKKDVAAMVK